MTSSLVKSKQITAVHFHTLFSTIFLFFDVPQYLSRYDYIKDILPAINFNNQKIVAHHLQDDDEKRQGWHRIKELEGERVADFRSSSL